ncbi:MAG TPA: IS21-like element helper ATPase IstB [Spirochaetota bacterium]|nr:IS21-like element helper ATPase IstB [Spirochaetota bacterium]HPI90593.1 IS21-like element helper ATPase IstB [Spirochaetota bacterium]HPR49641.1 IS21-like element helper ATPase IstB [Spirochaetota bacterium]HPR49660.1 IS21-like element helper ATPase IstB [Spirochaetota bacterium]
MNEIAQLKPKLSRLKMSGILEQLDMRISQAEESHQGYSEFLLSLFQDEIERRDFKVLTARLKKSGLDPRMTMETFDFRFNLRIHEPLVREIATCVFVERAENIFLVGPSGVGKTHLASALGHEACRRGIDVLFRRTYALLKWLGSGRADDTFERKLKSLAEVPLLILDDFGLNELDSVRQNDLYELICARYESSATIITSNRDFSEWQAIFDNPLIGSAALDRLVHRAIKVTIEGKSYRLDSFSKKNQLVNLTGDLS